MRELTDHKVNPANDKLTIKVLDNPGAGGANHAYEVTGADHKTNPSFPGQPIDSNTTAIVFQNGPIGENGVNGLTQEVLLAIVADRLRSFQAGPFSTRENSIALTHVETALLWLHKRTLNRMRRGVEGTHVA